MNYLDHYIYIILLLIRDYKKIDNNIILDFYKLLNNFIKKVWIYEISIVFNK